MKVCIIIYLISAIITAVGNALLVLRVKEIFESKNIKYEKATDYQEELEHYYIYFVL